MHEPRESAPEPIKPPCRMAGEDGNVFAIISRVRRALRNAGLHEKAEEFVARATSSGSYDEVLALCFEFVEID